MRSSNSVIVGIAGEGFGPKEAVACSLPGSEESAVLRAEADISGLF
jgi:hypothetical protein